MSLARAAALFLPVVVVGVPDALAAKQAREHRPEITEILDLLQPRPVRKPSAIPLGLGQHTQDRLQAFHRWKALPQLEQAALKPLFAPPRIEGCVESERYPLRSCYRNQRERYKAEAILAFAEEAWESEVDLLGFWTPRRGSADAPEDGVDFFLGDTISIGAAGYTSPIDFDPSTPRIDCLSYVVINEHEEPGEAVGHTVRHEFNHTCQLALDCLETLAGMEATAVWVEGAIQNRTDMYFHMSIREFQSHPERSIGWSGRDSLYPYGASLFMQFIQEYLGNNDPRVIPGLWADSIQNVPDNEPDLLDAFAALAVEQGGSQTSALLAFGEWRYFLGRNDDGEHFREGDRWVGAEPRVGARFRLDGPGGFPLVETLQIQPLGYYYADLELGELHAARGQLIISAGSSAASDGLLELWSIEDGVLANRWTSFSEEECGEEIVVDLRELEHADRLVLMVLNAGKRADWDQSWREQTVYLGIDYLPAPSLSEIEPAQVTIGQSAELSIRGTGFTASAQLEFRDEAVQVVEQSLVDSQNIICRVAVGLQANPGMVDLVLTNLRGALRSEASLPGALELLLPPPPRLDALEPDSGEPGERLFVRVIGSELAEDLSLELLCPEVSLDGASYVDSQTLYLHIDISEDVGPKACDLQARDRFGQEAVLADVFHILLPQEGDPDGGGSGVDSGSSQDAGIDEPRDEEHGGDDGCECSSMSGLGPSSGSLVFFLLLFLLYLHSGPHRAQSSILISTRSRGRSLYSPYE